MYDATLGHNSSANPIRSVVGGIPVVSWGMDDNDGKASVRRALETLLLIKPEARGKHFVFDDGEPNVSKSREEGYQAYLIGDQGNDFISLASAVNQVLTQACEISLQGGQNAVIANPPAIQDLDYNDLPLAFRQYLSSTSQDIRHKSEHISTEAYWNQLDNAKKNEINEIYKYIAAKPKPDAAPMGQSAFFQNDKKLSWNQLSFKEKAIISEQTQAIRINFGGLSTLEYWEQIDISQQMELREQAELNNAVSNLDLH
ncbi:hypothetical protein [Legionella tucsonensis]|uniref:Uncharacterized protein n=1 Tax=Legionella tucsonensis TaxID=40335 RepID=A0A0W0ZRZ9_9GAMM|nr:hypothetical protein [Legionella tucsonensis]KTD71973.1 hypothetical protein Ltuc_2457 [Legionella tucsonensis]